MTIIVYSLICLVIHGQLIYGNFLQVLHAWRVQISKGILRYVLIIIFISPPKRLYALVHIVVGTALFFDTFPFMYHAFCEILTWSRYARLLSTMSLSLGCILATSQCRLSGGGADGDIGIFSKEILRENEQAVGGPAFTPFAGLFKVRHDKLSGLYFEAHTEHV